MALGGGAFFTASRMIIQHRLTRPPRFVGIRCLVTGLAIGIAASPWLAVQKAAQQAALLASDDVSLVAVLGLVGMLVVGAQRVCR